MCKENLNKLGEDLRTLGTDLKSVGKELLDVAEKTAKEARHKAEDAGVAAVGYAKENPLPVLGVAALVGLTVGFLVGRK